MPLQYNKTEMNYQILPKEERQRECVYTHTLTPVENVETDIHEQSARETHTTQWLNLQN